MARQRKTDRPFHLHLTCPTSVVRATEQQLPWSVLNDRPKHGSFSHLVESLLRRWLEERGVNPEDYREKGENDETEGQ